MELERISDAFVAPVPRFPTLGGRSGGKKKIKITFSAAQCLTIPNNLIITSTVFFLLFLSFGIPAS